MALAKRYDPKEVEPRLEAQWQEAGVYQFSLDAAGPVYSIDTPPPTVSGHLHLGHVYSYSHPDFMARFWRMNGCNVFYPMGFDDNGLPTERLVEKRLGVRVADIGRNAFIARCLQISDEAESDYRALWQRLGLSIDWRYTYRTIDAPAQRIAQRSFIELYQHGLAYHSSAPAIWCPECRTAIAQAELSDIERSTEFVTLAFYLESTPGESEAHSLPVATTRPELLPACVAVFVHPEDARYQHLVGRKVRVPLFDRWVPILADPGAEPGKGTGAVMCCTFGDTADVAWWRAHNLPLRAVIERDGRLNDAAEPYAGLPLGEARKAMRQALEQAGLVLGTQRIPQSVRVHERCDTPVEYIVAEQWFIRVMDYKEVLLAAGEKVDWRPEHMRARYRAWVENLNWDWCISRQRTYGVPFPVWYCKACGEPVLAALERLPVNPLEDQPSVPCPKCGETSFEPDQDVMDTWATSSMSPQIVGGWLDDPALYARVFPFSLRPQAHEIIRTWAFYTLVKTHFHFDTLPWANVLISGWGLAGEGMGKISKSRGGGPMPPMEMLARYSADAVRYWAASTGPGKDSVINEEKIQIGGKLVTKLWNVARFAEQFLGSQVPLRQDAAGQCSPADRWILARLQRLIRRTTLLMRDCDYATAKSEIETFFWTELADNYLEMSKQRLYDPAVATHAGARFTLYYVLLAVIKLLAPFLPYVTEEIYQGMFAEKEAQAGRASPSIHRSTWPTLCPEDKDEAAEVVGALLVEIATAVRRFKSERNLPLGTELSRVQLAVGAGVEASAAASLRQALRDAAPDLVSITRALQVELVSEADLPAETIQAGSLVKLMVSIA